MCVFVDLEKARDGVPRKVMEWAMTKKGLLEVRAQTVKSLCNGAKARESGICIFKRIWSKVVYVHQ